MLFDVLNTFAEAEATGNTGTNNLGDVIDLGDEQNRDIGAGETMYFNVLVETAIAAGTSGTIQFRLVTSATSSLTSPDVIVASAELDAASGIPAGTVVMNVAIPSADYKRYLGVQEIVGTANTTAGKVTAFLSPDQRAYKAYKDAVS